MNLPKLRMIQNLEKNAIPTAIAEDFWRLEIVFSCNIRSFLNGTFQPLPKQNVDFGGGLERLIMAVENNPDMFETSLYQPIIKEIEKITKQSYEKPENKPSMRIISDHLKASVFLIKDGVLPSNKEQGYVLRRLLRRLAVKLRKLLGAMPSASEVAQISKIVLEMYEGLYFETEKMLLLSKELLRRKLNDSP